jgi:hypothetical protein
MRLLALLAASLLFAFTLAAQDSSEAVRGPDGGTRVHVEGIKILPITGKPFSGVDSVEWTRTLEDGTVMSTHLDAKMARDAQGRIYRERVSFVPANSDEKSRIKETFLMDPIAHTRTVCNNATRRCEVTGYYERTSFTLMPVGPFDNGKRYLTRESLGSDMIDGLNVNGTRETITISPGVVGNSQNLVTTREFWYSPDLEINLSVTRKDPREGTQVIRVTNLSRGDPDGALFQVPANFVVEDHRTAKAGNGQGTANP